MTILGKDYAEKLSALRNDALPGGFNGSLCGIIRMGRSYGLHDDKIRADLIDHTPERCAGRESEIDRALANTKAPKRTTTEDGAESVTFETAPQSLPEPLSAPWETFLTTVFRFDDPVMIAPGRLNHEKQKSEPDNEKRECRTVREWLQLFEANGGPSGYWPQTAKENHGCFVVVNPTTGAELKYVARFENILVEIDGGTKEGQLGAIRAAGLPVVTLTDSGGKSVHAIVRTEKARGAEAYKGIAKRVYSVLGHYEVDGAPPALDIGNCSGNRYTRLAGSFRGQNLQALLEYAEDPETVDAWLPEAEDKITLAELPEIALGMDWAEQQPPPQDPVLEGLHDTADKVCIIGSSKARKTFFALQYAITLAADDSARGNGLRFARFLSFNKPAPRRVCYLNLELKKQNMHRRFNRMCGALGVQPADLGDRIQFVNLRAKQVTVRHILALARRHRAEVLVIDPLYKILTGDENTAEAMKPVLAMFDRIAEEAGAAVVYIHHNAKGRAGDKDTRDRGAGSGVLARDFDAAIYLTDHIKGEGFVAMSTIARNYAPSKPVTIEWTDGYFSESDEPPVELTTTNARTAKANRVIEIPDILEKLKTKGPVSSHGLVDLVRAMGPGRDAAIDIIKRMKSAGQVETWREPTSGGVVWHGTAAQIKRKISEFAEGGQRKIEGGEW